jgi:UV DNA damage repair endonuclease
MKKYSLCCISLELQKKGFKSSTMTKTRFLAMNRESAIAIVSKRTLNNIAVTKETLKYCANKNWNYRISSNLMPLETLPEANL